MPPAQLFFTATYRFPLRVTSASQELLTLVPEGSSNSIRQVLTVASEPLVMVTRVSWPVPQSEALVKLVVTLPAPKAEVIGTAATVTATTALAQRARRSDLLMRRLPKQLGNFPDGG